MPADVELIFLPPDGPELQPAEHLWPPAGEVLVNPWSSDLEALQGVLKKWDVTVPDEATRYTVDGRGAETATTLAERIGVGLFTAEPGRDAFEAKHVIVMERRPIRSGAQVLKFVTDRRPTHAGIDP